eukprot:CAMPEP_0195109634 /NCGR_PEP_ID=MMETSP0448-20130528/90017_1 /TAXON_ID=66468 /ORGANISM="Heterocapsa triquestra, Strain CCMP 448" /LENGTH=80 /DNA_ID=CAMNT_0040146271 /DNA_START=51 /DNA_END=289 /DNA_ORIENTATION=+
MSLTVLRLLSRSRLLRGFCAPCLPGCPPSLWTPTPRGRHWLGTGAGASPEVPEPEPEGCCCGAASDEGSGCGGMSICGSG